MSAPGSSLLETLVAISIVVVLIAISLDAGFREHRGEVGEHGRSHLVRVLGEAEQEIESVFRPWPL